MHKLAMNQKNIVHEQKLSEKSQVEEIYKDMGEQEVFERFMAAKRVKSLSPSIGANGTPELTCSFVMKTSSNEAPEVPSLEEGQASEAPVKVSVDEEEVEMKAVEEQVQGVQNDLSEEELEALVIPVPGDFRPIHT